MVAKPQCSRISDMRSPGPDFLSGNSPIALFARPLSRAVVRRSHPLEACGKNPAALLGATVRPHTFRDIVGIRLKPGL